MVENEKASAELIQSIGNNLGLFFSHLFPGVLIIGAARLAYPRWFSHFDAHSWQHLLIVTVIALMVGNIWFAINRYILHQVIDFGMYCLRLKGPVRRGKWWHPRYIDGLAQYTRDSVTQDIPSWARQHIRFRASAVLLLYIVGEVGLIFCVWHDSNTLFALHPVWVLSGSAVACVGGLWQDAITRRIDFDIVEKYREAHVAAATANK